MQSDKTQNSGHMAKIEKWHGISHCEKIILALKSSIRSTHREEQSIMLLPTSISSLLSREVQTYFHLCLLPHFHTI